jgi:hypothetical protein
MSEGSRYQVIAPDGSREFVVTKMEASRRLNISIDQLEAMAAAGKLRFVPVGLTQMVPTREVERLERLGGAR